MGQSNPAVVVHVHQTVDVTSLERRMSELNEKADRIEAKLDVEASQGLALKEEVSGLRLKLDQLLTDTYAKTEVNAILDRIEGKIPGVVPDDPAPVGPVE